MRKSELGNLVAANMADIMESDEHRNLFRKQASCPPDCECSECEAKKDDESAASDGGKKCKCADECKCDGECKCKDGCKCPDDASVDDSFADDGKKDKKKDKDDKDDDKKDKKDKDDKKDDKKDAKCTCEKNCKKCMSFGRKCTGDCPCANGGKKDKDDKKDDKKDKKDKKSMFVDIFHNVLKISETLDELGLSKSAFNMIKVADALLVEAAGAENLEELVEENKGEGINLVETTFTEAPEGAGEASKLDPRMTALEFGAEEDGGDLAAILNAVEEGEAAGKSPAELAQALGLAEPAKAGRDYPGSTGWNEALKSKELENLEGLDELEAANVEIDAWLKSHGANKSEEIELDADLSNLLITAEKEVEDYLIEKKLSFEDES